MCKLLRHPFITNEDVNDLTASAKLLNGEQKKKIVKQIASGTTHEEPSPIQAQPVIEVDSSIDESDFLTNQPKDKPNYNFVIKEGAPIPSNDKEQKLPVLKK